jgi:hypothetical protein
MNIEILKAKLEQLNIPQGIYSLSGGLPNESYCIAQKDNKWEVYYSEHGSKSSLKTFENENVACEHFLALMKNQKF